MENTNGVGGDGVVVLTTGGVVVPTTSGCVVLNAGWTVETGDVTSCVEGTSGELVEVMSAL